MSPSNRPHNRDVTDWRPPGSEPTDAPIVRFSKNGNGAYANWPVWVSVCVAVALGYGAYKDIKFQLEMQQIKLGYHDSALERHEAKLDALLMHEGLDPSVIDRRMPNKGPQSEQPGK